MIRVNLRNPKIGQIAMTFGSAPYGGTIFYDHVKLPDKSWALLAPSPANKVGKGE